MSRVLSVVGLYAVLFGLSACQTDHWGTGETVGTVGGAAAGGLVGSQFGQGTGQLATTGLGVFGGAWAGNEIGAAVDRANSRPDYEPKGQPYTVLPPENPGYLPVAPVQDGYQKNGGY